VYGRRVGHGHRRGDTVATTRGAADRYGVTTGQSLRVVFADGESAALRVVAVVPDGSIPAALLPRAKLRAHDPAALTSAILVERPVPLPPDNGARVVDVATYAAEPTARRTAWSGSSPCC
jgi:putative ABC transport system permease protein